MSDYRLQIVHVKTPHEVAKGWQPGDRVETDFVDELCQRVKGKLGTIRTEASVTKAIKSAWVELLRDLKSRV